MSIRHIIIARAGTDDRSWARADLIGASWQAQFAAGTALQNLIGQSVKLAGSGTAPPDFTISTHRTVDDLVRLGSPDDFGISPDARKTVIWAPLGVFGESESLWGECCFVRRDQKPLPGERLQGVTVPNRLRDFLQSLAERDNGKLAEELWIRRHWTCEQVSPGLFKAPRWKIEKAADPEAENEAQAEKQERKKQSRKSTRDRGGVPTKV